MKFNFYKNGDSRICERVLRALPDWFGIEESTKAYIEVSNQLPMIAALVDEKPVGFVSLKKHSNSCYEIYVMGVVPGYHRKGVGRVLIEQAEAYLQELEVEYLQVKTVSSARECEFYKKTRLFYQSIGFKELEVFPTLWDESNPCLLMIKSIRRRTEGVNHITLSVSNLERSFLFYRDTMGFTPKFRSPKGAYFSAGDLWLAIEEDEKTRKEALAEYTHIAFSVEEDRFDNICKRVRESGAKVFKENRSEGKSLYFLDPDGHKLEWHVGSLESRLAEYRKRNDRNFVFY